MDGPQRPLSRSLQRNLARWLAGLALAFALLGGLVSGLVAFLQAQELQDSQLRQLALLADSGQLVGATDAQPPEDDEAILIQRLTPQAGGLGIVPGEPDGWYTRTWQGADWRVYVHSLPASRLAVAQRVEVRDEVATGSALRTFLPTLLLIPVLVLTVNIAIRRHLRPLKSLARKVDAQDGTRLESLPAAEVPQEIAPFLAAIDRLLTRGREGMAQQQRFVADAAHELRTPVAALSLQAENIARAQTLEAMQARLQPLSAGLTRLRTLVAQLLDLARLQATQQAPSNPVDLGQVLREVVADLHPLAEYRQVDLGLVREEPLRVLDQGGRLGQLVRNAIDNAIRYTPAGGQVDIELFDDAGFATLLVQDTGPGIPEAALGQAFEPFSRCGTQGEPGNGLGLAISREIARRLGGHIELANRPQGGLSLRYRQPLDPSPQANATPAAQSRLPVRVK